MCIDHRSPQIAMAQQRLNRPNVIARLQQMAGKTVAECMRGGAFNDLGFSYRRLEGLTHMRFMQSKHKQHGIQCLILSRGGHISFHG